MSDAFVSELISDHFAVVSVLRAHRPPLPRKVVSFRSLSSIDVDKLMADLKLIPMIAEPSSTMEGLIEQYNIGVAGVISSHAPTKIRSFVIRPENQWFSMDIAAMRRLCRKFERIWRRRGLTVDREILLHHRRSLAGLISTAKSSFLRNKIAECGSDRRSLFSLLDRCLTGRKELTLPRHSSPGDLATEFGHFFNRKIADIRADLEKLSLPTSPACEFASSTTLSVFDPVNAAEIIELVLDCPSKSSFLDPIPTYLLKKVIHVLAKPIANLVNISLSSGAFPSSLKCAYVTPLLKKPSLSAEHFKNYRPVSGLSFISKLIERVVLKRLIRHLSESNLLASVQSAYRASHSTETALLRVLNDLLSYVSSGDCAVLALLDLSAAFDTVDHSILLSRLESNFGLTGKALSWLRSYLTGRRQSVRINGATSDPTPLVYGVPQGSVLGPVLFILYTTPLFGVMNDYGVSFHFFADDTQAYTRFSTKDDGSSQSTAFQRMADCVAGAGSWMQQNKLQNNVSKLDALIVSADGTKHPPASLPLAIGADVIIPSPCVKNLGVVIDSHLSLEAQIRSVCKKAFYQIRRISRIRKFLDPPTCNSLVCALVSPHLDYANSLYYGLPEYLLDRLQRVQNAAARLVIGANRFASSKALLKSLHWLPVRARIQYKIAVLGYRCINGCAPSYLCDLITKYVPIRALRSSHSNDLCVPKIKCNRYGRRSFMSAAPSVWNQLPLSLKLSPDLNTFCAELKTHLFRLYNQPC